MVNTFHPSFVAYVVVFINHKSRCIALVINSFSGFLFYCCFGTGTTKKVCSTLWSLHMFLLENIHIYQTTSAVSGTYKLCYPFVFLNYLFDIVVQPLLETTKTTKAERERFEKKGNCKWIKLTKSCPKIH